jgi:methionine-rich copper-binding protein CopC
MKRNTSRSIHAAAAVAISTLAIVAALGSVVAAHAKLEKTEPASGATLTAPPPHVQLWFNEKLDASVSKIDVTGPTGKIDIGPAHSMEPKTLMAVFKGELPDGKYTVNWQTAGDDGHAQKGTFEFTVKRAH